MKGSLNIVNGSRTLGGVVLLLVLASLSIMPFIGVCFEVAAEDQKPDLYIAVETDKDTYYVDEMVNITFFLVNNENIDLVLITQNHRVEISGPSGLVLGYKISSIGMSGIVSDHLAMALYPPVGLYPEGWNITIPPNSQYSLGWYVWDQKGSDWEQVPPGKYHVRYLLDFYGYEGEKDFQIIGINSSFTVLVAIVTAALAMSVFLVMLFKRRRKANENSKSPI